MLRRAIFVLVVFPMVAMIIGVPDVPAGVKKDQTPPPPSPPFQIRKPSQGYFPNSPRYGRKGERLVPEGGAPPQQIVRSSPQDTGGPDAFGYTWDNSLPFSWVDATGGTETGISGDGWGREVGPIPLPFSFRYYEEIYNQVWIAASGYLAFSDTWWWNEQQDPFPSSGRPNEVIAPFWTIIHLQESGPTGRIYYHHGGTAPNRYFVVEWYNVAGGSPADSSGGDETYHFEVILHENGDIVFQYHTMIYNDWRYYASIGIEDKDGNGLGYMDWGNYWDRLPTINQAVRFYRPAPAARVNLSPGYAGSFTSAGKSLAYELTIRNTGELGTDTFDLVTISTWPLVLYDTHGTALTDTDGDTVIDTGPMLQGGIKKILATVQTPMVASVADHNLATLTATSSLDPTKSRTSTLQAAVPAPFAQAYKDQADSALSLYLVKPDSQVAKKVTPENYSANYPAIAETPGFVYLWTLFEWTGTVGVGNIEYSLINADGDITRGITRLTDNTQAAITTYDYDPVTAVAPDGSIGVLWYRELNNFNTNFVNYNIWFAVLNSSGDLIFGPQNMTNDNTWWQLGDPVSVSFYNPRIAATEDNRFVLAWTGYYNDLGDIYCTVRNTNGTEIMPVRNITNATDPGDDYNGPAITRLGNNRVLLSYGQYPNLLYTVLDSAGNTVKLETATGGSGFGQDAVQLSDGRILLAWSGSNQFVILDGVNYDVVSGPTLLINPVPVSDEDSISVTADSAGHGILTWRDGYWSTLNNLYYALVDGDGNVLTQPMIFKTAKEASNGDQDISTSFEGYGNTSFTINPTSNDTDAYVHSLDEVGAAPGGVASVPIAFGNDGLTTATSVVVTATLDVSTTYTSDTSGITPTQNGNTLVWEIPTNLSFLGRGRFSLQVRIPFVAAGTRFPIVLEIDEAETDANAADNTALVEVMAANQVFLPMARR